MQDTGCATNSLLPHKRQHSQISYDSNSKENVNDSNYAHKIVKISETESLSKLVRETGLVRVLNHPSLSSS